MECRFAVVAAATVAVLGLACTSRAYEYRLETPTSIGKVSAVSTAQINSDGTVSESLTSFTQSCNRVCGPRVYYCTNGTWDGVGNPLNISTISGACQANPPISIAGSEEAYTVAGSKTVGFDARGFGYEAYPASHYAWTTDVQEYVCGIYYCLNYITQPNGGNQTVNWTPPTTFSIQLTSDGDLPLNVTSTITQVTVSGYGTVGTGTVTSVAGDCLSGPIAPGSNCTLVVTFDPSTVTARASTGYGYNVMTLALASDAGALPDWSTHFTVTGIPVPEE